MNLRQRLGLRLLGVKVPAEDEELIFNWHLRKLGFHERRVRAGENPADVLMELMREVPWDPQMEARPGEFLNPDWVPNKCRHAESNLYFDVDTSTLVCRCGEWKSKVPKRDAAWWAQRFGPA